MTVISPRAPAASVLYVRLPCWKIWPGGVVYVADWIHKHRPTVTQHLLDLALIPPAERTQVLTEHIQRMNPDVVAFSWRNMQSFGPHPEDDALGVVMNYDYGKTPWRRIKAAFQAVGILWRYQADRLANLGYFKLVKRIKADAQVIVGGTAVSIFGRQIAERCPPDTLVVVGEGEDAMLSIVDGAAEPLGEYYRVGARGAVEHHARESEFPLSERTAVDFPYVETIFPQFGEYLGMTPDQDIRSAEAYFGVNTKRGCPLQCNFCLYNKIEGAHQRYREPVEIVNELELLHQRYGVQNFWFTDAQFCSTKQSAHHVEEILDEILRRDLKIAWAGYLRLNHLTPGLAKKMIDSGITSIDLSFTGTQEVIDSLTLGYKLDQQMDAFRMFKAVGFTDQKVKLYIPFNAPGETVETLSHTIARIEDLYALFGRENVLPFIFFIGVQPGTPIEKRLIAEGYLPRDYNPLTMNPFIVKKLLYNPEPLGGVIGRAYLEASEALAALKDAATNSEGDYIGRATMDVLKRELARPEVIRRCTAAQSRTRRVIPIANAA
jgi:radical SAM superfamily enzyme YgiQ (UPF0313 family)